jgi:heme O synthase-like polyprenyltransferase
MVEKHENVSIGSAKGASTFLVGIAAFKLSGIPIRLAFAEWKLTKSAAEAAIKAKKFFFISIVVLPVF